MSILKRVETDVRSNSYRLGKWQECMITEQRAQTAFNRLQHHRVVLNHRRQYNQLIALDEVPDQQRHSCGPASVTSEWEPVTLPVLFTANSAVHLVAQPKPCMHWSSGRQSERMLFVGTRHRLVFAVCWNTAMQMFAYAKSPCCPHSASLPVASFMDDPQLGWIYARVTGI